MHKIKYALFAADTADRLIADRSRTLRFLIKMSSHEWWKEATGNNELAICKASSFAK